METLSAHITLETKVAEFKEQEHASSMNECRNMCSVQRFNIWLVTAAAQVGDLNVRQRSWWLWWKASLLARALASHSVQVWMLNTCRRKQGQIADKVPPNKQWLNRYSERTQLGFIMYYSHFLPLLNLDKVYLTRTTNLSMARLTKAEILIFKYRAQMTNCWTWSCQRALAGSSALILIHLI